MAALKAHPQKTEFPPYFAVMTFLVLEGKFNDLFAEGNSLQLHLQIVNLAII